MVAAARRGSEAFSMALLTCPWKSYRYLVFLFISFFFCNNRRKATSFFGHMFWVDIPLASFDYMSDIFKFRYLRRPILR